MSKFKFVNIIDTAFLSLLTFLIVFAWVQFFLRNLAISLFVSAVLAISIMLGVRWFKSRKHTANQQLLTNNNNLIKFKLAIQTMSNTKLCAIIKKLIPQHCAVKSNKGDIIFNNNNIDYTFTFYYSAPLTDTQVLELIKTKPCNNLVIFCSSYSKDAQMITSVFKNKNVKLIDLEMLYKILNQNDISVNTDHIDINKSKISIKELLKNCVARDKSKGYFVSGLVLLFTSIIIPYRIYYVVFSSILFLLSLICRLKPTIKTNQSLFD